MEKGFFLIPNIKSEIFNNQNSTIQDNHIFSFHHDKIQDKIWMGFADGKISNVDLKTKEFSNFKSSITGRILFIREFKDGLFIGGDGGVEKRINLPQKHSIWMEGTAFKDMIIAKSGDIYFGLVNGVKRIPGSLIDSSYVSFYYHPVTNQDRVIQNKITNTRIYSIYQDFDGLIWMGSIKGIFLVEPDSTIPFEFSDSSFNVPFNISDIIQSNDSTIWVSTQNSGVLKIKNQKIEDVYNEDVGLSSNLCKSLYVDPQQNIWIGTNAGLNILNPSSEEIKLVNKTKGLPSNEINTMYGDEDGAWIGTSKGLAFLSSGALLSNHYNPPIHLTSFKIWEKDTTLQSQYTLSYNQNSLTVEYIGLAYRMRGKVNYKYRLMGLDTNWVKTTSNVAKYPILNPGEYEFQVIAINEDGF